MKYSAAISVLALASTAVAGGYDNYDSYGHGGKGYGYDKDFGVHDLKSVKSHERYENDFSKKESFDAHGKEFDYGKSYGHGGYGHGWGPGGYGGYGKSYGHGKEFDVYGSKEVESHKSFEKDFSKEEGFGIHGSKYGYNGGGGYGHGGYGGYGKSYGHDKEFDVYGSKEVESHKSFEKDFSKKEDFGIHGSKYGYGQGFRNDEVDYDHGGEFGYGKHHGHGYAMDTAAAMVTDTGAATDIIDGHDKSGVCSASHNTQICCKGALNGVVTTLGDSCKDEAYCCKNGPATGLLINPNLFNCVKLL
ncbi:hypothetical protein HIM_00842 [Hirsutella minnesotensis 3608]|nr:hypothetical protein HIM_00842 [Hirsutella minnesotensis 3608]